MTKFEKIAYGGWQECYRLSNDIVDLVITEEVGPRIIRYGFIDQANEFAEFPEMLGKTGGDKWRIYGGHRLWHAPEIPARTYAPDNGPVDIQRNGDVVRIVQPVEASTGIQKEIDIILAEDSTKVTLTHRLRNLNLWTVRLAPWSLSVMAPGGKCIVPLPPRAPHSDDTLLPTNTLTMWAYTDFSDSRWTLGRKYIMLAQDINADGAQKVGLSVPDGWAAYARNNHLFVKRFAYDPLAIYPDHGSVFETFTNRLMLEVETLGPLVNLAPGAAVEHVEHWSLHSDIAMPATDQDIDTHILPIVQQNT